MAGDAEEEDDPPHAELAEEVRVPAVLEQPVGDKAPLVGLGQVCDFVAVLLEHLVLSGLEVELLVVGGDLAQEQQQPEGAQHHVPEGEVGAGCVVDGSSEPVDQVQLVVGGEEEVEQLHQHLGVVLPDVGPAVVFARRGVSAFAIEVVCQPNPPRADERQHDPLPQGDGQLVAVGLIEQEVAGEANRQQGPHSVHPRVVGGQDAEQEDHSAQVQQHHSRVLVGPRGAVLRVREVLEVVEEVHHRCHCAQQYYQSDAQPKIYPQHLFQIFLALPARTLSLHKFYPPKLANHDCPGINFAKILRPGY